MSPAELVHMLTMLRSQRGSIMTSQQTQELYDVESRLVVAVADRYPTWERYRQDRNDVLVHMTPNQISRIRSIFEKHHSVDGYCRAVADDASAPRADERMRELLGLISESRN